MGLKRILADFAETLTGTRIMLPEQVGVVFEEEHIKRFFEHFRVDCVFDVGANEGQYSEMLRRRIGYTGPIISFEPIPELAAGLRSKMATSRNWFVEEVALDSSVGTKPFNIMAGNQFSSLRTPSHADVDLFREANAVVRTIDIETSTLPVYYEKYRQLLGFSRPYLKLDTQGHDLAVVQGAGETIHEFVGLQSELAVRRLYAGSEDFLTTLSYYRSKGFELSAFVPNNVGHFPVLVEIDCIMYRREPASA